MKRDPGDEDRGPSVVTAFTLGLHLIPLPRG